MRKIYVKGMLRSLAYDINSALDNNVPNEKIVKMIQRKIDSFKDSTYIKVVWD